MSAPAIEARELGKHFGRVEVLREVSLRVAAGSCHGLLGENGAGKSTLGKIFAGLHAPSAGDWQLFGRSVNFSSPRDALAAGVAMVHQELAFCPDLSVAENLALGRWPTRAGLVDRGAMELAAREALQLVGLEVDVRRTVGSLSTAQEQLVQIAQALSSGARLIVFDEATSSLDDAESDRLMQLVERLVAEGRTIVWVSHRLPEVLRLCDHMTVLRDGAVAGGLTRAEATEERLVELLVGEHRELRAHGVNDAKGAKSASPGATSRARATGGANPGQASRSGTSATPRLRVRGLRGERRLGPIDLDVAPGEIVGLSGLLGSGRSRLLATLFGLLPRHAGEVSLDGVALAPSSVRAALEAGLGLVPEDRKRQGLVLDLDAEANVALGQERRWQRGLLLDRGALHAAAGAALEPLEVRGLRAGAPVGQLSGGNQQKVLLARWLARRPQLLLVDEPTRGVDVGAKAAIHAQLRALASSGASILLVSSDRPELHALADRVVEMREGVCAGV